MRKDPHVQLDDALNELETLRTELAAERARTEKWRAATLKCVQIGGELLSELADERARADRAEAALRELGKHPEECEDDSGACVSHLAYEDVKADRDRLRAAIEQAPHDMDCESVRIKDDGYGPVMVDAFPLRPCNCWKRAALGER